VRELLAADDLATLGEVLDDWLPADLGALLELLEDSDKYRILHALSLPVAAQAFEYLDRDTQERLLDIMTEAESASILEVMAHVDRTALLPDLAPERAARLIALLSPEQRAVAESLLQYSPDSVGRLMTPDYIAVKKEWTIQEVLDYVRTHGKDSETLNVVYVVDENHQLIDDLRIRFILLAPLDKRVSDVMDDQFVALKVTDAKKVAVEVFRKYDRTVLPVVDTGGTLVGIVT